MEFTFTVKERKGKTILGEVTQSKRAFIADVEGTFDGAKLSLKMTKVTKGAQRYYEYEGEVAGSLGALRLAGTKSDGKAGQGQILMQVK